MKPTLAAVLLGALVTPVQAAPNDGIAGTYARVEVGRSSFGLPGTPPQAEADPHGLAFKIFGGYRFEEGFGVEVGYAALGSFSEHVVVGSGSVRQDGKARSVFGVVTGRLPIGEQIALHGRLGLSSGKVTGTDLLPPGESLLGGRTSGMLGAGVEYRPISNIALTLNYDNYGKVSDRVKASSLMFGFHYNF